MKKVFSVGCLILSIMLISSGSVFAQQEGDIKVGGGLLFGTGVGDFGNLSNSLGLKADGYYTINEEFRAGADIGFYFPNEEQGTKLTVWEINFNGNYIFHEEDGVRAYALAGINITSLNYDVDAGQGFGFSGSSSETGLNLGAGGEYDVDFGSIFAELKYVLSDADQLAIGAGVRFPI